MIVPSRTTATTSWGRCLLTGIGPPLRAGRREWRPKVRRAIAGGLPGRAHRGVPLPLRWRLVYVLVPGVRAGTRLTHAPSPDPFESGSNVRKTESSHLVWRKSTKCDTGLCVEVA